MPLRLRRLAPLAGVVLGALLLPPMALAGQIRVEGGTLAYVGGGEVNNVLVQLEVTGDYIVGDTAGAITMDAAATEVCQMHADGDRAWCAGDFTKLVLDGWGGNDTLTVHEGIAIPAMLDTTGGGGDDTLRGGGGNDTLGGGPGPFSNCSGDVNDRDRLFGGGGTDTATYRADPTRNASGLSVTITLDNVLVAGAGNDGSVYTASTSCSFIGGSFTPSATENDDVRNDIENVVGTRANDTIVGSGGPNTLTGSNMNDSLNGGGGIDTLVGDDGNDTFWSDDTDADTISCGIHTDTVHRDSLDIVPLSECENYSPRSTTKPTVSGTQREGEQLTATASWEAAPAPTQAYVWQRCNAAGEACSNIAGATSSSYALTSADVGMRVKARVTATNSVGNESAETDLTGPIAEGAPTNSSPPIVTGTARRGSTLTASPGVWTSPRPETYAYQWERCAAGGSCSPVAGATSVTYVLTALDVGHTMRVVVTASSDLGSTAATSAQTATIAELDTTPPQTSLLTGPSGTTTSRDAAFTFSSDEPGSTFECSLDAGAFEACSSPRSYTGLADGQHTFAVRGTDPAGNLDSTPESRTWIVDGTPPETTITAPPASGTTASGGSIAFSSSENGSTFACSLDGAPFAPCTSPTTYSGLAPGPHVFRVQATDAAGNTDPSPAEAQWTVASTIIVDPPPPVTCKVPALKGKTLAQAKAALTKANCALGKVTRAFSTKAKKGKVLKQSIAAGAIRPKGAKVALTVGKGPRR